MGTQKLRNGIHRRVGDVTFEEFCDAVREDQKADLIDGVIAMASPENTEANDLFCWLLALMEFYTRETEAGRVFGSRVAFRLTPTDAPEPDVAFLRADQSHRIHRGRVDGPPDLAVEIVSPDSVERDYDTKRKLYERAGVGEYWIIDEHERAVTLYRRGPKGKFREVRPRQGELASEALPGFRVRIDWLWQDPRPRPLACLTEILNRPAGGSP
jgi:Uma2 family endonuclease